MKRSQPVLILDEPDPEALAYDLFKGQDDAEVIVLAKAGNPDAKLDLGRRKRMEVCWSGTWQAGAPQPSAQARTAPPIPAHWNRPRQKETLSGKLQSRAEVRKLYAQAGPKAQRDEAKYLLKTRYGQSVS